jgi:hypothetical protein
MDKVDILWAREQIKETKAKYFRYTDLRMTEDFLGVFTEDLVWTWLGDDNETVLARFNSRQEFGDYLESIKEKRLAGFSVHHGHTVEIDVHDEDTASAIWSMQDYLRVPGDKNFMGYGHYHEDYRRVGERWLISRCTLTRIHVDPLEGENALGT